MKKWNGLKNLPPKKICNVVHIFYDCLNNAGQECFLKVNVTACEFLKQVVYTNLVLTDRGVFLL